MKTQIYNVLILDKSGSMESIKEATIAGYNETVQSIKTAQKKYDDKQDHLFTFMVFCGCEKKLIYDKTPIDMVQILTPDTYNPCCMTPLYDAMGFCLTQLRNDLKGQENYKVLVTIITDGYENASREYDSQTIKQLINELKTAGWTFAYIGANQDVEKVSAKLSIDNCLEFNADPASTTDMFCCEIAARERFYERTANNNCDEELLCDYFVEKKKNKNE